LPLDFFIKNREHIDWYHIFQTRKFPIDFVEVFVNDANRPRLQLRGQHIGFSLSENEVMWLIVSSTQDLPEFFIERYKDKVDWDAVSKEQILSEKFIERFKDYVNWEHIFRWQNLSKRFMAKHSDDMYWANFP
jgi:hypothetical protein